MVKFDGQGQIRLDCTNEHWYLHASCIVGSGRSGSFEKRGLLQVHLKPRCAVVSWGYEQFTFGWLLCERGNGRSAGKPEDFASPLSRNFPRVDWTGCITNFLTVGDCRRSEMPTCNSEISSLEEFNVW